MKRFVTLAIALIPLLGAPASAAKLDLSYSALSLPGAPAQVLPVQLDDDPALELAVLVAYTAWDEIAIEETSEIDEVIGLVEVLTIVPALLEQRELWAFDRQDDGTWSTLVEPLELGLEVLTLETTSHPEIPLAALTDQGLVALSIAREDEGSDWQRELLVEADSILSGTRAFLPGLEWLHDLNGDAWPDLLFPGTDSWDVHLGKEGGFAPEPSQSLALPTFKFVRSPRQLDFSLPSVRDVDGDRQLDIVLPHPRHGWSDFAVYRNLGAGKFSNAIKPLPEPEIDSVQDFDEGNNAGDEPVFGFFDDLDGDGRAEYVRIAIGKLDEKAGMRKEMAFAKRPPFRYEIFSSKPSLEPQSSASLQFEAVGYAFGSDSSIKLPGGFWDLNGDGRRDLVAITLDFSMLQAVRILVSKSMSIGLDFQLHCQQADGSFKPVEGLDLSGRFQLNLNNFKQGELSLFGGDFDGDSRKDFVQIGRGKTVSIHRGDANCSFPASPDLILKLKDAPKDLALVQVQDLNGDGLDDLSVVQPEKRKRGKANTAVRLDLYMSRGNR